MTEQEPKLVLTKINPFTKRQGEIIELVANGSNRREAAESLKISEGSVRNYIGGHGEFRPDSSRSNLGIMGIIEKTTGVRPNRKNWIPLLLGDVVIFERGGKNEGKLR